MLRRNFIKLASAIAAGSGFVGKEAFALDKNDKPKTVLRKAVQIHMLPHDLPDVEKFELAKKCGFEGLEAAPIDDLNAAAESGKLARQAGVPIHSVIYGGWHAPLSDPDSKVIKQGLDGMAGAIKCAKAMAADTVLLVPAVVNEKVGYADAYKRSQKNIRKLLPLAEEMQIVIAVENVWNKFLLSPIEFARYVDEFKSQWLKAYFDVGNVILFGYAQDWIRTLGSRIAKIHFKDFKREDSEWVNLLDGDVNWKQVRRALDEIGYDGFLTPELQADSNKAYLRDLSKRMDKIIAG